MSSNDSFCIQKVFHIFVSLYVVHHFVHMANESDCVPTLLLLPFSWVIWYDIYVIKNHVFPFIFLHPTIGRYSLFDGGLSFIFDNKHL